MPSHTHKKVHHSDSTYIFWGNLLLFALFSSYDVPYNPTPCKYLVFLCSLSWSFLSFGKTVFLALHTPQVGAWQVHKEAQSAAGFVVRSTGDQQQIHVLVVCSPAGLREKGPSWHGRETCLASFLRHEMLSRKKKKIIIKSTYSTFWKIVLPGDVQMLGRCALSVSCANYLIIWSDAIKTPLTFCPFHMQLKCSGICSLTVVRGAPYSPPTMSKNVGCSPQLAWGVLCIWGMKPGTGQCEVLPQN